MLQLMIPVTRPAILDLKSPQIWNWRVGVLTARNLTLYLSGQGARARIPYIVTGESVFVLTKRRLTPYLVGTRSREPRLSSCHGAWAGGLEQFLYNQGCSLYKGDIHEGSVISYWEVQCPNWWLYEHHPALSHRHHIDFYQKTGLAGGQNVSSNIVTWDNHVGKMKKENDRQVQEKWWSTPSYGEGGVGLHHNMVQEKWWSTPSYGAGGVGHWCKWRSSKSTKSFKDFTKMNTHSQQYVVVWINNSLVKRMKGEISSKDPF